MKNKMWESKTEGSDEDYEDGVLEEFYDSDYDLVEEKKDDREFDKYIDITVEYGGVQTNSVVEHGVAGAKVDHDLSYENVVTDALNPCPQNLLSSPHNRIYKWRQGHGVVPLFSLPMSAPHHQFLKPNASLHSLLLLALPPPTRQTNNKATAFSVRLLEEKLRL
nr:uncharacterized protein LOC109190352 [Ipomoea batatas]